MQEKILPLGKHAYNRAFSLNGAKRRAAGEMPVRQKMKLLINIIVISVFLLGCNNNSSPLVGSWVTESCEQLSDESGSLLNIWAKGIYEFTNQSTILFSPEVYSDANCENLSNPQPNIIGESSVTYIDLGQELLQEGIDGGGLTIIFDTGSQSFSFDGYYTINNNVMCLSDSFTFGALGLSVSQAGSDAIDFGACLLKV